MGYDPWGSQRVGHDRLTNIHTLVKNELYYKTLIIHLLYMYIYFTKKHLNFKKC